MKFPTLIWPLISTLLTVCGAADSAPASNLSPSGQNTAKDAKLLEHFRQMSAITRYQYQETRRLELVETPWRGSGYLFSGTDGTLIKLQLSPERIIMAITATRMYYYNAAQEQRYSAPLDFTTPGVEQIGVFRSILQGRTTDLYADYTVDVRPQDSRWVLHLTGKSSHNAGLTIDVSGDETKPQRNIFIRQADGEQTEYVMKPAAANLPPGTTLEQLLAEAAGD